jgi:GntR family transcriptional regulator, histidine utilization repressor
MGNTNARPLYERAKEHILDKIRNGQFAAGALVPSEHELVESLGMSRMTVNRALRELAAEGLVSRRQGVGTFVSSERPRAELIEIRDIAEDVVARGHTHRMKVAALDAVRADIELAAAFDVRAGAKLFHSLVTHFEDDVRILLEQRYVTPAFAPAYLKQDFTRVSPGRYLFGIEPPTEIEHVVYASSADRHAHKLLALKPGEPCLVLLRRTWIKDVPTTRSIFTFPGSRYTLGSRYKVRTSGPLSNNH